MKILVLLFGSMGLFGLLFGLLLLAFGPVLLSIYGLVLAFKASIVLGVLALFLEPSPFILGLLGIFGHPEVAHKIAAWIGL